MRQLLPVDQLVTMLAEATGRKLSAEGLMAYEIALSDVPLPALNQAAIQLLRTAKFMPSPAEILESSGVASGHIATKDKPTLAWCDVRRAISRVGGYDSPNFSDPIINATIREMGGWVLLCDSTIEELVWREKDFLRMYSALSACSMSGERTERLAGICERENGSAVSASIAEVSCLTTGADGISRRIDGDEHEEKRITGPSQHVAEMAKRIGFIKEETAAAKPSYRTKEEQIAALSAMKT